METRLVFFACLCRPRTTFVSYIKEIRRKTELFGRKILMRAASSHITRANLQITFPRKLRISACAQPIGVENSRKSGIRFSM